MKFLHNNLTGRTSWFTSLQSSNWWCECYQEKGCRGTFSSWGTDGQFLEPPSVKAPVICKEAVIEEWGSKKCIAHSQLKATVKLSV